MDNLPDRRRRRASGPQAVGLEPLTFLTDGANSRDDRLAQLSCDPAGKVYGLT
jgi:hypothetical protein